MSAPVERKVAAAASSAGAVVAVVLGVLASLPDPVWQQLPAWAQTGVAAATAAISAFVGGYTAKHTPRGPGA